MANTYYNSQLTAAEIEAALEAISGLIVPANNGKVVAVNNGKFEARSVQWGGDSTLEPLSVTENGDYTPEAGVDGFDEVHVAVPNSYTASDEGKVVNNGALIAQTARASQITQNGTYDTTLNNEVMVNVSGGGSAVVQPLSVTQNGTYNPPSGVDGYAPVTVNVSGGGGILFQGDIVNLYYIGNLTTLTFNHSGYYAILGAIDGYSSSSISFSVVGATVIESDNKTSVNGSYGSAATGILLHADVGDSITITGTSISRQVMVVISIPEATVLSSLDLSVEKDRALSKTIQNVEKRYCFYIAGSTGDNSVNVSVTSNNQLKWDEQATSPVRLHKYGAFEGTEAINCSVTGSSYATNYAMFFGAE